MRYLINKKICIVGLGYVGLPLLLEFSKKINIIGFDINKSRINEIKKKLRHTIKKSKVTLFSTLEDLPSCQVYIITVPTPINANNKPDLSLLMNASEMIGKKLNINDIVIYESTVYPGTTEEICIPILEKFSNLKCKFEHNKSDKNTFHVGYSPERISPGDKNKISNIIKVTSGSNNSIAQSINIMYRQIIKAGTKRVDSIKIAEASKIIENIQRDTNIALVNQLSIIMNTLNIDIYKVLDASNTKWNFHYYKPGLVGGHCIAVDPYYMIHKSKKNKTSSSILSLSRKINEKMPNEITKLLERKLKKSNLELKNLKILILGCSYKENIDDVRNSKVFDLYKQLMLRGAKVNIFDPLVKKDKLKKEMNIEFSLIKDIKNIDLIILAVPHEYFLKWKPSIFYKIYNTKNLEKYLFDLKSTLNPDKFKKLGINIWTI